MSRRTAVVAALAMALAVVLACKSSDKSSDTVRVLSACRSPNRGAAKTTFHGSSARLGWTASEPELTADPVARGMKPLWTSEPFATFDFAGSHYRGRAYASPLVADGIRITSGAALGETLSVVYVATSNGDVYAIAASEAPCAEGTLAGGTVLWRTRLVVPDVSPALDGRERDGPAFPGIAVGTMSTPVLDLATSPPTLYVTAMEAAPDGAFPHWKLFALDAGSGTVNPGWPLTFERHSVEAVNTNGPAYFDEDARIVSQRSALALSPSGERIYVSFGGYQDGAVGWIAAVDTRAPRIAASFSGAADTLLDQGKVSRHANAGMWAPGGPSVDDVGRVYVTTGNSPKDEGPRGVKHSWGNSMLRLGPNLVLEAAYTPYDFCELDRRDVDLCGSSPILLPTLAGTSTPNLIAFGGKAGVVYLLDRDGLPPANEGRPSCANRWDDSPRDLSLLPLAPAEPYCAGYGGFGGDPCVPPSVSTACVNGPLLVFGPAADDAAVDHAKMRSTPAYFRADDGTSYVYVAGSTKAKRCATDGVPPSVVRLRVVTESGKPAHLVLDGADTEISFVNPGSPVITSEGGRSPVVWVVDQNAKRTQPLLDPSTPPPVIYAVDGTTMKLLWKSAPSDLEPGGKYVTPAVAHGVVYVATDRLHAFGVAP
jgi:outer membrane protein assembly factor BamB